MSAIKYTPPPMTTIWEAISNALKMSKWLNRRIDISFNSQTIPILPTDNENTATARFDIKQKPSA